MNKEKRLSGKTLVKRLLSFVLALAMMVTMLPTSALTTAKAAETKTIYLNAGGSSLWDQGDAWFAAWVWGSSEADAWYTFTDDDADGIYQIDVPADATGMKILRKNPASTALDWNAWNATGDLTISGNCFTITNWSGGTWSNYTYTAPTYTVAGVAGLCGVAWDVSATANDMTKNEETGLYEKIFSNIAAGTYTFKIAVNHSWDKAWGNAGADVSFTVADDDSTVTITFDPVTKKISASSVKVYNVSLDGTNVTITGAATVNKGSDYTAELTADAGYTLPDSISVTVGGNAVEHDYDSEKGTLTVPAANITGDITIIAVGEKEQPATKTIYLNAGGSGLWDQANAWFSAKVGNEWFKMTDPDFDGIYQVDIPDDATTITFYRNDPAKTAMEEASAWNKTNSLTIGGNCYTITGWGGSDGRWSNYTPSATTATFTVAGESGLCGSNWDVSAAAGNDMTMNAETGLYEKVFTGIASGTYEFKVVLNHSWDKSWGNGGNNASVTVDESGSTVTITFDAATQTVGAVVTAPGSSGGDETDPSDPATITVYFRNDWLWTDVRIHFWGSSIEADTTWPGKAMSYVETGTDGNDIYSCEIPADVTGIVFTGQKDDGSGLDQSPDIKSGIADGNAYYMHWDDGNKCSTFDYTPPTGGDEGDEGDEGDTTLYTVIFHFANTVGWSPVNLYVWNDDGATTGSWPGAAITKQDENGYHTMTVTYEASTNNGLNYIFNNGSVQTIDLNVAASAFDTTTNTAELWIELDSTPNAEGKYVTKQVKDEELDIALAVSPKVDGTSVTFEYAGDSSTTSVEVRGTVPGASWGNGIAMTKNSKGIWTVTVENLAPAVYEYKFVVNGTTWTIDPANGKTNSSGNSVFTIVNPNAEDTNKITINVFYERPGNIFVKENADGTDTGVWNAYVWGDGVATDRYDFAADTEDVNGNGDKTEMVTTIIVENGRDSQNVYLKPRLSTDSKDWLQEEAQVTIALDNIVSGTINVYVVSDGTNGNKGNMTYSVITETDIVTSNKIVDLQYDYDNNKITVTTLEALENNNELELVTPAGSAVSVTGITASGTTYTLSLSGTLDLVTLYQYGIEYDGYTYAIGIDSVYASDKFAEEFTYSDIDKELGATYTSAATTFKVWAPTAESVSVNLYESGTEGTEDLIKSVAMARGEKGVWSVTVDGDWNGTYYTYSVKVNGETIEAVDPYARTTGVNGNRGMVIDLDSTDPADGWSEITNKPASYTDAVIYELHVRDFSIDDSSGVKDAWQGKFMGLTQAGTTVPGTEVTTGLDYLKDLGITHLHLLPIYDYASVDETTCDSFNWGYDPQNYNTPEGSYSTDPFNGEVRVKEMKEMVDTLHENGIGVIMDVVYNHVYDAETFSMNQIVPGYFSRVDSNRSGCGNDTASEREMVRKFIVESVLYWAEEYHIDGFRFDLVGLIDVETINQIVTEVHKYRPDIIFYGEGWDMDDTNKEPGTEMAKQGNASKTPGFAYFSDNMRNLLGGDNGKSTGFVSGSAGREGEIISNFMANPWWTTNPTQVVQYASCHDNYTLVDKLILSTKKSGIDSSIIKMNNLAAAIYMTSQGIPFIHAGEEILREKLEEDGGRCENSYNASDFVNHIEWSDLENATYAANFEYYKGLIAFRKAHPALSLATSEEVKESVKAKAASGNVVAFAIDGYVSGDDDIYVIFNANSSTKTVSLPAGEWTIYINGTKAGTTALGTATGSVSVAGISAMVLTKPDEGKDAVDLSETVTLYFSNNKYWENVYAYAWVGDTTYPLGQWPGTEMTYVETNDYGEEIYSIEVPAAVDGIIFHNNNGAQTVDLTPGVDGTGYYCTDETDGKWNCGTYVYRAPVIGNSSDYFLIGYIDGVDYDAGGYEFIDGKLTATFSSDSYVYVRNGDASATYMTDGYLGQVNSATLYDTAKKTPTGTNSWDKLLVPGGVEVTFTLIVNDNNTVTLSYEVSASSGVEDTSGVQDGVTLHCWNWSFEEIEKNMAAIAAQGYTAIQTSPVQPLKEATNLDTNSVGNHWWLYYQPVDFVITTEDGNALGTKADLESMIKTAHKYGIKVIVDVVANHLANQTGNDLSSEIPEEIRNNEDYWHDITTNITNWNDRYDMTQNCMGGLPDLNTANDDIQKMVLDFLKECVDIGVDGFRFDAAKSIETPDDGVSFASDFWPTVAGGAEEYAKTEYSKDLYLYGEVLDNPAISASAYTKYMAITDNSWGNNLRNNIAGDNAALADGYHKAADASNLVIWAESHDTYATDDASQSSFNVSEEDINKTWALVAARADAMGLYLARPESMSQALGVASATGWDNIEVQAVNEFHNAFVGTEEVISNEDGISYVERGTAGVVLVNASGTTVSVNVTAHAMADGTYIDQITGNIFTVADGKITGEIGSTGIAVVYNPVKINYEITEGMNASWTLGSGKTLSFRANGDFYKVTDVQINGTPIDAKNYTVTGDSTVLTLKAEFLQTLPAGTYTLTIVYTNGSASTEFTIAAQAAVPGSKPSQPAQPTQPNQQPTQGTNAPTGDTSPIAFYSVMALAALAVIAAADRRRRRA